MLRVYLFIFLCVQSTTLVVDSARILGVFPIPSFSHQIVFRALMLELAKRGHELVIITPNPALPKDRPPDNITEIDTSEGYELMSEKFWIKSAMKRGVILNMVTAMTDQAAKGMMDLVTYQFKIPEVKKLLNDKSQKFDLVIVEGAGNFLLMVSHIFNAPAIVISSFQGIPESFDIMGTIGSHPLYYPHYLRQKYGNLSFWEKIYFTCLEFFLYLTITAGNALENSIIKEHFGPDAPSVKELQKNIQMLFVNAHPIFGNNRPVPPSVVYLGGLHLQPVKELPQDLKTYLDNSSRGVVYVSLGSNVRPTMMDQDLLDAFVNAFAALPYDVLWKFDGDKLLNQPKNVKIQKWFPQRDLLMHPKIKVFVYQGGLQSTDETIDAAVPIVGIPMMGDQWYNVQKCVELGIGEEVDALTMTADDLLNAINKVIANDSYRKNIERLRAMMKDQPQQPLERAVWWTEHVLRYGGAHLRAPSVGASWSEYFLVDVFAIVMATLIVALTLLIYVCCKIVRAIKRTFGYVKAKRD